MIPNDAETDQVNLITSEITQNETDQINLTVSEADPDVNLHVTQPEVREPPSDKSNFAVVFFARYYLSTRPSNEEIVNFFNKYGVVHHINAPVSRNFAFIFMISLNTQVTQRRTRTTISQIIHDMTPENKFHITVASSNRNGYQQRNYQQSRNCPGDTEKIFANDDKSYDGTNSGSEGNFSRSGKQFQNRRQYDRPRYSQKIFDNDTHSMHPDISTQTTDSSADPNTKYGNYGNYRGPEGTRNNFSNSNQRVPYSNSNNYQGSRSNRTNHNSREPYVRDTTTSTNSYSENQPQRRPYVRNTTTNSENPFDRKPLNNFSGVNRNNNAVNPDLPF